MRKEIRKNKRANLRWIAHARKVIIAHLGPHMDNETQFVAFIAAEIAESLSEEPP